MSGGSYDYLYMADSLPDLFNKAPTLKNMADGMRSDGEERGADLLEQLYEKVQNAKRMFELWENDMLQRWNKLAPLMKAYEWFASNDWGFDSVKEEAEKLDGMDHI